MSYRTITVKDISYEYVVGRTHLKIKGVGIYLKSLVGDPVGYRTFVITPKTIARVLRGQLEPEPYFCSVHETECHGLAINPFQSEARGRSVYMPNCAQCITASREAI
jgi:hypothetical protein